MVLVQYWLSIEMQFLEITENKSKTGVATMLAKIWDTIIWNNVKKVLLWGNSQDLFEGSDGVINKIKNWFTNKIFLNSFKMTEKDMNSYIRTINDYKPKFIRGYAGSLYELAKFSEKNNLPLHTPQILVASAETLTSEMRTKIKRNNSVIFFINCLHSQYV